jgi:serine protease Do
MRNLRAFILIGLLCRAAAAQTSAPAAGGLERLDFRQVIREAKQEVFPAVVFIKCIRDTHESGKRRAQEVSGSGVIISEQGELLTNWHVIEKATEVRCLLYDGRAMDATVVGSDKDTDLALVQLTLPADARPLPFAKLGDASRLQEGDFVMAMGAPWGLSRSVSIGIVSCTRRYLPENSEYSNWLQTDASISPGNSGGPLVNTDGEIVGINSRGVLIGGDMGFSVPSQTILNVVTQIRGNGRVNWSWVGLQLQPLRDLEKNMYFDADEGVMVAGTDPDSPARAAGIEARDRIVSINGKPVMGMTEEDLPEIRTLIGLLPKGRPADVEIYRGRERRIVQLTPREKGSVIGDELDCPRWDLTMKAINQFENPNLHFHRKEGVFIYGVKYPGNASSSGLQSQDIILAIDSCEVRSLQDVKRIHEECIKNVDTRSRVLFNVLRGGLLRQFVLDFRRDYERQ